MLDHMKLKRLFTRQGSFNRTLVKSAKEFRDFLPFPVLQPSIFHEKNKKEPKKKQMETDAAKKEREYAAWRKILQVNLKRQTRQPKHEGNV